MRLINMTKTGLNIKRLQKENSISVQDLQTKLCLGSKQSIYKWYWGQSLPDIQNLVSMSEIFNCKVEDILIFDEI